MTLTGGGSGFFIVDTDDPRELTDFLQPCTDLVSWDVHAIYELSCHRMLDHSRQQRHAAA